MPIDPTILAASRPVAELPLCDVRLQDDARFPWLVLVPRVEGARELEDLAVSDRVRLMAEVVQAGVAVRALGVMLGRPVEKLNVGALGNIVGQLHIHVVGRRRDDPAWPGPAWGAGIARPYDLAALAALLEAARAAL